VRAYPELQNKVMISNGGGSQPVWSPDGQTLFYRNANRMMTVSIETTPTLKAGIPQMLFNDTFEKELFDNHNYDIHPDGDRFVMIKSSQLMRIDVVENWISELERLISSGE